MNNLPKLSSTFQQSQFRSEINKNQAEIAVQYESRKPTTASQGRNLSPFTWNNIKLPVVLMKQKQEKVIKLKEVQTIKQITSKKQSITTDPKQAAKQKTQAQKAKRALNISIQLKKMLPQKGSPVKNLHEQVIMEYQKHKFTSGLKKRESRSFTQKQGQNVMIKAYQTMEVRGQDKYDLGEINDLKKTQQRYRNTKSIYDKETGRNVQTGQQNRYSFKVGSGRSAIPSVRAKHQGVKSSSNQKYLIGQLHDSIIVKSSRNSFSKNNHSTSINQQMQPYIRQYFRNITHKQDSTKLKIFVTTNPKYHPLHMNEHNTSAFDNGHSLTHKTLIWTKVESLNVFRQKSSEQYYNHVEGSHVLTSKQKLNEILNGGKGNQKVFYPVSFSFPKQYNDFIQEYDWTLVKMCLKFLAVEIKKFQKGIITQPQQHEPQLQRQQFTICLSDILDDLTRQTKNQPQAKLLKFCLFLQQGRKKQKLNEMFEKIKTYRSVDINLSENLYIDIIDWCLELMKVSEQNLSQSESSRNISIKTLGFQNIDYRLIQLLKAYDYLFSTCLPSYLYKTLDSSHNTWLIKPFASSKAAGISMIINSSEFYTTPDYEYKQYRHRSKYYNKIFMKYIENPLLIKHSGMDYFFQKVMKDFRKQIEKMNQSQEIWNEIVAEMNEKFQRFLKLEEKFCGRKFDIRQWVVIVCDEQTNPNLQNEQRMMGSSLLDGRKSPRNLKSVKTTKIYKYHTAYCRFAQKQYSLDSNDPQIHLTNYEMYKKSSLKTDRKSPSIIKDSKSLNGSIMEKNDYANSLTEQTKGQKNGNQDRVKTRKRLGSMMKEQKESVLMLDELFEYIDFIAELKQNRPFLNHFSKTSNLSSIKTKYETQLNTILSSLFSASLPHIVHHNKTFELFGVDLLLDENMNLYLLEVNLNPGCASEREQKLNRQAQMMLETMFETVMGHEVKKQTSLEQHKNKQAQLLNNKLIGSKEYIEQSDLQVDSKQQEQMEQSIASKQQEKSQKEQKWQLVCQNTIQ